MTRQVGNEIDEFVTDALRNNLLGLPLDLATINMARGRDTGVPSLNAARREFFEATDGDSELRALRQLGRLRGRHSRTRRRSSTSSPPTARTTLITGADDARGQARRGADHRHRRIGRRPARPADCRRLPEQHRRLGAPDATITGLNDVDLWIGGLAEKKMPFGGMLGSTFNFVFETQMEKLQNGDRFYYLQRTRRPAPLHRAGGRTPSPR